MEGIYILGVGLMAPFLVIPIVLYIFFKNAGLPPKNPDRDLNLSKQRSVEEPATDSDAADAGADIQCQSPRSFVLFVALGAVLPAVFFIAQVVFDPSAGAADIFRAVLHTAFWGAVGMVLGAIVWDSRGRPM